MPYRTLDDRIDGLVITFINLSDLKQVEGKLHETEQVNRLLLNSSPDVIVKLSTDWKILEFNPEAEKFFGKKRDAAVNQNFIRYFIPEPLQKKTEKDLKKLLDGAAGRKFEMQVLAAEAKASMGEWSVNVLLNSLKMPAGLILSLKQTLK